SSGGQGAAGPEGRRAHRRLRLYRHRKGRIGRTAPPRHGEDRDGFLNRDQKTVGKKRRGNRRTGQSNRPGIHGTLRAAPEMALPAGSSICAKRNPAPLWFYSTNAKWPKRSG